jgi:hypothetical protein
MERGRGVENASTAIGIIWTDGGVSSTSGVVFDLDCVDPKAESTEIEMRTKNRFRIRILLRK